MSATSVTSATSATSGKNIVRTGSIGRIAAAILSVLILSCLAAFTAFSAITEEGLDPKYKIIVDDEADFLEEADELKLVGDMRPLSKYGTVVFWTSQGSITDSETKAKNYIKKNVSTDINFSSVIFLIDMGTRQLEIFSCGKLRKTITISNSYSITNNVAWKATAKNYYGCASEAFSQMLALTKGNKVFVPMRYICSILLALAFALLFAYINVRKFSVQPLEANYDTNAKKTAKVTVLEETLVNSEKTRRSSDSGSSCGGSSCGGGSSSSCGGGGGGSSCGGGGSSGF